MTKNRLYTQSVERGGRPESSIVPTDDTFVNENGQITNLLFSPIQSVAHIQSNAGCVRANHYHLTDAHYSYVISGEVLYFEREIGSTEIPEPVRVLPGQMFYTPPMREHAMVFPVETTFMTFAPKIRDHEHHEQDVRRVQFITPEILRSVLSSASGE